MASEPRAALLAPTAFSVATLLRLAALVALGSVLLWAVSHPNLLATALLTGLAMLALFLDLLRVVRRTNLEVARLTSALAAGDLAQRFTAQPPDLGFPKLGQAMDQLMSRLREEMTSARADAAHLSGLLQQVPIALLTLDAHEQVTLLNDAARRLFDRPHGSALSALGVYGADLPQALRELREPRVVRLSPPDDAALRLRASQTALTRRGQALKLIALQPIESELDATEMALSRDLVRVLTHEIMNSLTPVLSLARTAAGLSAALPESPSGAELRAALETVERRAAGLMQFVERYRELSAPPALALADFPVELLLGDLQRLFRAEWPAEEVALAIDAAPDLRLTADRQLLEHALLNLLRNAAQACHQRGGGRVRVRARAARRGRVLLEVEDDGPGIPEGLRDDVFLPFFTTRPQGSGVGLSLAKQIVVAHGGSIRVEPSSLGGACLRVVL